MDVKASGTPKREVTKILTTSPILEEIKYLIKAFMFI